MANNFRVINQELRNNLNCKDGSDYVRSSGSFKHKIFGDTKLGGIANPITLRGNDNLCTYLNLLCTNESSVFSYCKIHSDFSKSTGTIVDLYELCSQDGNVVTYVYIDQFHPVETVCAPLGLRLRDISELTEEEVLNLCKPVRLCTLNFTDNE